MPTVWVRGGDRARRRFHRHPECEQLLKKPCQGQPQELVEMDVSEITKSSPCKFCYHDAPRPRSLHLRCHICSDSPQIMPCVHNGGVEVWERVAYTETLHHEAGEIYARRRYVWPESVAKYTRNLARPL